MNADTSLSGTKTRSGERIVYLAYADNITVIIINQKERNQVNKHLKTYEKVPGAKLNHYKIEGVWSERRETAKD